MNNKNFTIIDNDTKYLFQVSKLKTLSWMKLFEKLLKLLDYAQTGGESLKKILHVLAQTGKYSKDDLDENIENMDNKEFNSMMIQVISVIKDALLQSSFEEHKEIYDILLDSLFYLNSDGGVESVNYDFFDDFKNRFAFYNVMKGCLQVHFDFLESLKTSQKSQTDQVK